MSKAYPWVLPPHEDKKLKRVDLEDRIEELLHSVNTCTLATLDTKGRPAASPIEYCAEGLDLFMLPDVGSPKLKAMERNSYVSLAVHNNHNGWSHARGAQYFGDAKILDVDSSEWKHGMEIFPWRVWADQMEWSLESPPPMQLVKIIPQRILYTETWLWKNGLAPRQTWRAIDNT
ncbi:MAG: pyridoxamine 5'-phosphate oxidase family protein [Pseudomonadota bacterium]|nr:pyridoxamine 5'-phosphate oxidase family protein [Pseudomonadota bacterium]